MQSINYCKETNPEGGVDLFLADGLTIKCLIDQMHSVYTYDGRYIVLGTDDGLVAIEIFDGEGKYLTGVSL